MGTVYSTIVFAKFLTMAIYSWIYSFYSLSKRIFGNRVSILDALSIDPNDVIKIQASYDQGPFMYKTAFTGQDCIEIIKELGQTVDTYMGDITRGKIVMIDTHRDTIILELSYDGKMVSRNTPSFVFKNWYHLPIKTELILNKNHWNTTLIPLKCVKVI